MFQVLGEITKLAGSSSNFSVFGPRILLPESSLEATALVQPGARVGYARFYQYDEGTKTAVFDSLETKIEASLTAYRARVSDYESQQRKVGRALDNVFNFLNLVGFSAILLGMIGVSVTIKHYLKSKFNAISVLRCMGAKPQQARLVYLYQILLYGAIGSLIGTSVGVALQALLPVIAQDLAGGEIVFSLSASAILLGMLTGLLASLAFSWAPLYGLGLISPLQAIRADKSGEIPLPANVQMWHWAFIGVLILALSFALIADWKTVFSAIAGLSVALGVLSLLGWALMKAAFAMRLQNIAYPLKQGIANLYRPNNQTLSSVITVGMGVLVMGVLYLSQQSLLSLLNVDQDRESANLVFLDIQNDQRESAYEVLESFDLPKLQDVPIVTMRLDAINGRSTAIIREDSTWNGERWALGREYRSSYRNELSDTEKLLEGEFISSWSFDQQPVPISAEQGVMESLQLNLGDTLSWDVQGVMVQSYISSIREVDWQQISPNFFMIFPDGVLDYAPQTRVIVSRAEESSTRAQVQSAMVRAVPNASTIDISALLGEIRDILNKLSAILQVMGALSIVIGLVVLAGSIQAGQRMRMAESLLLRTIGAPANILRNILVTEYFALTLISVSGGLLLSLGASALINVYFFEISAFSGWTGLLIGALLLILGVALAGYNSSKTILKLPPLQILRNL